MSQCHRHHRLAIEDYVWEAVVRGLQGPDVCLFSLALVQAGSGRTDRQGEFPGKRRKKKKKEFMFLKMHVVLLEATVLPGTDSYTDENHKTSESM